MGDARKGISVKTLAGWVIVGVTVVTKATASAVVPLFSIGQSEPPAVWPNVRGEFEPSTSEQSLDPMIVDLVETALFDDSFETTIRFSYSMVPLSQVGALDRLWIDTLIRTSGPDAIETFVFVRSSLEDVAVRDHQGYLDRWVWKVSSHSGAST